MSESEGEEEGVITEEEDDIQVMHQPLSVK